MDTSGDNWLRDYLPKTLPNIRVLLYEYDTTINNGSGKQSIVDLAKGLLVSVEAYRRSPSVRIATTQI